MRQFGFALLSLLVPLTLLAVEDVVGVVKKADSASKTIVVRTADGVEHTFHFVGRTAVHGMEKTGEGAKDVFHGVKEGSEVAVHYTVKGTEKTAEDVDNIGKDGLKATEGTVTHLGSGGKTIAIKTADGTEETFHFASRAATDAGKDIAKGTEKSAKVTVYYTEDAGKKVAHFFKKT